MELKKILLFGLSMAVISSSAMAFDCNKIEPEARIGVAIDNVINSSDIYQHYNMYSIGLLGKYQYNKKIDFVG